MLRVSEQRIAQARAATDGPPLKRIGSMTIYGLPPGFMNQFALVLFDEGQDFPDDRKPAMFELRFQLDNRWAYLIERKQALAMIG
jgi:hypothetical protein